MSTDEWAFLGPYPVEAGDDVTARLTGTGDADLYVRFGGQPSIAAYHCRPYASDSNETCELTTPDGESEVYFGVRAYRAAEGEAQSHST